MDPEIYELNLFATAIKQGPNIIWYIILDCNFNDNTNLKKKKDHYSFYVTRHTHTLF